jgi:hypothetical protein
VTGLAAVVLLLVVVVAALLGRDRRFLERKDSHPDFPVPELFQDPGRPGRLVVLGPVAPLGQLLRN